MNKFSMYSYSWDIAENGVSETLTEYEKMGINTVTLAGSYHAGKFFRPKSKTNKIYFLIFLQEILKILQKYILNHKQMVQARYK